MPSLFLPFTETDNVEEDIYQVITQTIFFIIMEDFYTAGRYDILQLISSYHKPINTIQYNTIQYNTIQYNTIQCIFTIQYNTIQYIFFSIMEDLHCLSCLSYNNRMRPKTDQRWMREVQISKQGQIRFSKVQPYPHIIFCTAHMDQSCCWSLLMQSFDHDWYLPSLGHISQSN